VELRAILAENEAAAQHKKDAFLSHHAACIGCSKAMTAAVAPVISGEKNLNDGSKADARGAVSQARTLTQSLARYREPNQGRSIIELLITVVPFVLLWLLMCLSLRIGYGLYLLLAVPAAGFLVRLFMIQHDCGHGSLFRHR
jgi:hypothetical protein